jgi:hypothetical protein
MLRDSCHGCLCSNHEEKWKEWENPMFKARGKSRAFK